MPKINILSESISNRIAAGEVVQRPASAVKELIENSIDAKAKNIVITVKKGGKESILILDDGVGMDAEDAELCFKRHATSKIKTDQDLFEISNYGFRGEALASISSISHVELSTSEHGAKEGRTITLEAGQVKSNKSSSPINGTRIKIDNIFYNTPARKKFQKTVTTEFNHILQVINNQAIISHDVSFELIHDNKSVFKLSAVADRLDRIIDIYGPTMKDQLIKTKYGYTSKPTLTRSNRNMQKIYVNDRIVHDKTISYAIYNVYKDLLPKGRHPITFLLLTVPHEFVDINVHPTKDEIKFKEETVIYNMVTGTLKDALRTKLDELEREKFKVVRPEVYGDKVQQSILKYHNSAPTVSTGFVRPAAGAVGSYGKSSSTLGSGMPEPYEKSGSDSGVGIGVPESQEQSGSASGVGLGVPESHGKSGKNESLGSEIPESSSNSMEDVSGFVRSNPASIPYVVYNNLYISCILKGELCIIDQHTAHERVLYERFKANLHTQDKLSQELLFGETINLLPTQVKLFTKIIAQLEEVGFRIDEFGENDFVVRSIPSFIKHTDLNKMINDILDDLGRGAHLPV